MAGQIYFFSKNKLDVSNENAVLTASQGNDYINYVRNRSNESAWMTTGSVDADNTAIEVDFGDQRSLDFILLIEHNFKAYTLQYWDGGDWVDFSTPISETTNVQSTTFHLFDQIETQKIKLTIQGAMVVNAEKYLYQFVASTRIGQLNEWPMVAKPQFDRNISRAVMLSGKSTVSENLGGFACSIERKHWIDPTDLDVVEALYASNEGFLVWLCGGDETQFPSARKGYRKKDLFLMKCVNDYSPEYVKGLFKFGLSLSISLVEVND